MGFPISYERKAMPMKQNIPFFTLVVTLLLVSAIALTGCMHAITTERNDSKPYDPEENPGSSLPGGSGAVENVPEAQLQLRQKFAPYLHEDGTTVTIFSEEQYATLLSVRENDRREPLTGEEILYLISDSISLYFSYDEIRLTNANRDGISPMLSAQSGAARIISPGYRHPGDFATCSDADRAYQGMLCDIYDIIYYRIYMHDAGFETVYHTGQGGEDMIFGNRFCGEYGQISSAVPQEVYQMLAVDGSVSGGVENEEKLCAEYKTMLEWKRLFDADKAIISFDDYPQLRSAVLYTSILTTDGQLTDCTFYMAGPKTDGARLVYPTAELENLRPLLGAAYQVSSEVDPIQPSFSLKYEDGSVVYSPGIALSVAWTGKFSEEDGVLKLDYGDYWYVFEREENGYRYRAEASNPLANCPALEDGVLFAYSINSAVFADSGDR